MVRVGKNSGFRIFNWLLVVGSHEKDIEGENLKVTALGVIHKLRGQDEVGKWSVKCPRLST